MDDEEEMVVAEEYNGEEEEEEERLLEYNFTVYEIDLDYEFDAARYFDFSRAESPSQASRAEAWFDSAPSYPPSPFVARLLSRLEMEMANISPKSKGVDTMNLSESGSDSERDGEMSAAGKSYKDGVKDKITSSCLKVGSQHKFQATSQKLQSGFTFYNHMANMANVKNQTKYSMKPTFSRTSTLMKPTASQLAKQNCSFQAGYTRSLASEKSDKNSAGACVIENQAAKRQKLEGGLLRKVEGATQQQQNNFIHKAPKREGLLDKMANTNTRITIPRGPDLETAHRAQRTRPKSSKEVEYGTSTVRRFKARPLNRKILEAPSLLPKKSTPQIRDFQEFHLKTSERAMHHSSAASKFTIPCNNDKQDMHKCSSSSSTNECGKQEHAWPSVFNASKPDGCLTSRNFKALPLDRKILTSKGDIGIFRNKKKEATVPMEFNFQTEKRYPHNPPIELFNKLSLASDSQALSRCEPKLPWSISAQAKGSKENRWGFQQVNEPQIVEPAKPKLPLLARNQQF